MFKSNRFAYAMIATSLTAGSFVVSAEESVTSVASITVQNAFDLTEVSALSFGTLAVKGATAASTTSGNIVINADGTAPSVTAPGTNGAAVIKVVDGAPAEYAVANTAPFSTLTITVPTTAITVSNPSSPSSAGDFAMDTFTVYNVTGSSAVTLSSGAGTASSDVNGDLSFRIGAKLTPSAGNGEVFNDGLYTGTYEVRVKY